MTAIRCTKPSRLIRRLPKTKKGASAAASGCCDRGFLLYEGQGNRQNALDVVRV